jgi:anti-anti-sigma factor
MAIASDVARALDVAVVRDQGSALVRPQGELDGATSSSLALVLARLLGDGCSAVVLDLADLASLDAAGAWLVGEASRLFGDRGGELVVRSPRRPVRLVLDVAGLSWLIESRPEALDDAPRSG